MVRFMRLGILLLVLVYALDSGAAQTAKGNSSIAAVVSNFNRIVGGRPTTVSNIPYIVALRYSGNFICGGSLITRRHVLTAAHCIFGFTLSRFVVVAGITRLTDTGVTSTVIRARMTRGFNMDTLNQDVAVLSLARTMVGNNIQPIRLCNRRIRVNAKVRISGWGLTSSSGTQTSNRLRTAEVPIISRSVCRRRYFGTDIAIGDSMLCAGKLGTRDACDGDSGGPLVYRGRLCGIVSFGVGCATPRFPGVYTSVSALKQFIVQSVR